MGYYSQINTVTKNYECCKRALANASCLVMLSLKCL